MHASDRLLVLILATPEAPVKKDPLAVPRGPQKGRRISRLLWDAFGRIDAWLRAQTASLLSQLTDRPTDAHKRAQHLTTRSAALLLCCSVAQWNYIRLLSLSTIAIL